MKALIAATALAAGAAACSPMWFKQTGKCGVIIKTVEGAASVVDGDTVVVNGITVRLKGVDAPEQHMPGGPEATAPCG